MMSLVYASTRAARTAWQLTGNQEICVQSERYFIFHVSRLETGASWIRVEARNKVTLPVLSRLSGCNTSSSVHG